MSGFNEFAFRANVDTALVKIKTILDNTRNPQLPAEVAHEYTDKYLLAEFITNTGTGCCRPGLSAALHLF